MDELRAPELARPTCRKDYRPPDWLVPQIALDFALDPERTIVRARLEVARAGAHRRPLVLDGEELELLSLRVDGEEAAPRFDRERLVVPLAGAEAVVETEVALSPAANRRLMGLYESGGILCTQCEAEGFRRIAYFPDRPDVLSRYRVRMEADEARFPVLLSNGDRVEAGDLAGGRHYAVWEDPFPTPSYLFALVAGDLKANRDRFVTRSGKAVDLAIWVREQDLDRTGHAMESLKAAMRWDEEKYGREYDLSQFNIVAVSDFNFGAMENKSLNIFNSRYVLADPETATDADYDAIAGVVGHEYFHNWSGNRVTCRDWFQLSLKEGFTVFRDQQFSADIGSPAVKRIEDVRSLRAAQFPEDAGPLAHPVRPDSYIEISNFYTATVYNKGAELIRMMRTLLGEEGFRAGCDLFFERHDGKAVTCEDFVRAMEEAGGVDLARFRRWYSQAGTPRVRARLSHDAGPGRATLELSQETPATPGQAKKEPVPIPLKTALLGSVSGRPLVPERTILLEEKSRSISFDGLSEPPILSINRDFSAPVIVDPGHGEAELAFLSAHDDDPFARYEAMQQLMLAALVAAISRGRPPEAGAIVEAVGRTLASEALDPAFVAEAVLPPSEAFIGDQMLTVDPEAIHAAREALRRDIGAALLPRWRAAYKACSAARHELSPAAKGARRLKTVALAYLAAAEAPDAPHIALRQYRRAGNMTDRQGALGVLSNRDWPERETALEDFRRRYRDNALVIDKWFAIQALSAREGTAAEVERLARHPDFSLANPNRLRALVGSFAANQRAFHEASGRGYRFLAGVILELDRANPQLAARLVPPLGRWRRFGEERAEKMRAALARIAAAPGLSRQTHEQAARSLG
ncbi:MAG: aminopeptidase N [Sphingomonadaceae bacterium]